MPNDAQTWSTHAALPAPLPCAGRSQFTIGLTTLRRLSPHEMPVASVGYLAASTKWAQWPAGGRDFSLSFVFGAAGRCRLFGKTWPIIPPCMFTTWPGAPMEFGPQPGGAWEEFYICYNTDLLPLLQRRRLACVERPTWPIHDPAGARGGLAGLCQRLNNLHTYGQADRIDRLCDALLTDTLIAHDARALPNGAENIVRAIEAHIAAHLDEPVDFTAIARRHGLSPTHFRRLWRRFYALPPKHYVLRQRMLEACRLLAETDLRVNEIAARLGFHDTLYFSKQFHRIIGVTAGDYRINRARRDRPGSHSSRKVN